MTNDDLKNLLLETHPVRPGQEARAWATLAARLRRPEESRLPFFTPLIRVSAALVMCSFVLTLVGLLALRPGHIALASAHSQSPGIFATAFYSHAAHAQIVWLDGLEPATDQPSYLDDTTVVAGNPETPQTPQPPVVNDPNRL